MCLRGDFDSSLLNVYLLEGEFLLYYQRIFHLLWFAFILCRYTNVYFGFDHN